MKKTLRAMVMVTVDSNYHCDSFGDGDDTEGDC